MCVDMKSQLEKKKYENIIGIVKCAKYDRQVHKKTDSKIAYFNGFGICSVRGREELTCK